MNRDLLTNFDSWYGPILENFLKQELPNHSAKEAYHYALKPWGKLFRPKLCAAISLDLGLKNDHFNNLAFCCLHLELHHTYSLIHDDMPCMDDDDLRRGRESVHKKFSEWQALLSGDGLLNLSYRALSKVKSPNLAMAFKLATKMLGPQGLIDGQYLDLSKESSQNPRILLLTHELKTARLIQLSLLLGLIISSEKIDFNKFKFLYRQGHSIGVLFQLIDDLSELSEEIGQHEVAINPWPLNAPHILDITLHHLRQINQINEYPNLNLILFSYREKMREELQRNKNTILSKYPNLSETLEIIIKAL